MWQFDAVFFFLVSHAFDVIFTTCFCVKFSIRPLTRPLPLDHPLSIMCWTKSLSKWRWRWPTQQQVPKKKMSFAMVWPGVNNCCWLLSNIEPNIAILVSYLIMLSVCWNGTPWLYCSDPWASWILFLIVPPSPIYFSLLYV